MAVMVDTEKQKTKKVHKKEEENSDEKPFEYVSYQRQFTESDSSDDDEKIEIIRDKREKRESIFEFDELKRKMKEIDEFC